jgi:HAD superfamily hydrolase (TIGR01662 family)
MIRLVKNAEAVLFDLDDTLFCTSATIQRAYFEIAHLAPLEKQTDLYQGLIMNISSSNPERVKEYLDSTDLEGDLVKEMMKKYTRRIWNISLFSGVIDLLKLLKQDGKTLGIVSNGDQRVQEMKMKETSIIDYFVSIEISNTEIDRKPSTNMFQWSLEELHITSEKTVFVGDKLIEDIAPARKIGMKAIQILQGKHAYLQDINSCPENLKTVAIPDVIITNISELIGEGSKWGKGLARRENDASEEGEGRGRG